MSKKVGRVEVCVGLTSYRRWGGGHRASTAWGWGLPESSGPRLVILQPNNSRFFLLGIPGSGSMRCQECRDCDLSECYPLTSSDCLWGIHKDSCFCCNRCAKGLGESCGGRLEEFGKCGPGMGCTSQDPEGEGVCSMALLMPKTVPIIFHPQKKTQQ
ncbi:Serine protease HTRA1B-like [Homarus americanus]|uniref:Serine protease HTRA1B-like n=1 Tax=Homarus americanus TaxID=6706 RepID=A0A8J5JZI0_HOMAM|nr:Serine protease HTRA1B-like [Homarus americanus]